MSSGVSSLCKSRPSWLARTTLQAGAGGGNVSEEAGVCGKIALNVYNGGDRRAAAATGDGREKTMRLNEEEKAILAGEMGEPRRLALEHQMKVGTFFDAADFVPISHVHIMADTEALGEAGVAFLEKLAAYPEKDRRVRVPAVTDPRGADFSAYKRLKQDDACIGLERRTIAAFRALDVLMHDTCLN